MSFLHPQLLWLLLVPAGLLLAALRPALAATVLHPKIPRATFRPAALELRPAPPRARPVAVALALAALVLALARPQGDEISTPTIIEARDVLVAVDVSRSMLADDVAPDRLSRARLLVRTLADELKGERLGLLPFAGTAFLQSPLSADYEIFRTFLDELGPDMIPAGGSDFTALLTTASEAFGISDPATPAAPGTPAPADRYLIVLSDGEAQDDSWKPLAEKLAARGVRVLALGLGTPSGAMMPDGKGGLIKDERGAVILTKLDATTLRELARLTDGAYRDASAWVDLPALLRETVARGRASRETTDTSTRREELFVWFLAPALALLALALLREFPVTPRPRPVSVPKLPTRHAAALGGLLLTLSSLAAPDRASAAEAPAAPPPDPLVELVGSLADAPEISPADLARLATLTATRGEEARAAGPSAPPALPEGALRDALAAVEQGAASAPSAADWAGLRQRLETLLAPPPEPPKKDPSKSDKSKNDKADQKDPSESKDSEKSDSDPSSKSEESKDQKPSEKPGESGESDKSGSPDQSKPGSEGSPDSSSSSDPSKSSDSASEPSTDQPGKPSADKPLGDLGSSPDKPDENQKPEDQPVPAPGEPKDENTDAPTQRAGGVSSSGDAEASAGDQAALTLDPALAVPQQHLQRVRDSDAPARLYQLIQEAETPPDSVRKAAPGTPTRDW